MESLETAFCRSCALVAEMGHPSTICFYSSTLEFGEQTPFNGEEWHTRCTIEVRTRG